MQRLGITGSDKDVISSITADGRIDAERHRETYSTIMVAAAMPDDDFGAFIGATTLLLADMLQGGGGDVDLYHNWDAFRGHYQLADPPVRAALMNGFRLAEQQRLVTLSAPPDPQECITFARGDVISTLQSVALHDLSKAVRDDISPEEAGALWQESAKAKPSWQLLAGFRYLYERPQSIVPPDPHEAPLIPWV